jgi:hypothetical protein
MGIGWYVLILFGGGTLAFYLLGRFTRGTGAELLDWDPSERQAARRRAEDEDIAELLELANRERRKRGEPDLTEDDVIDDVRRQRRRRR